MRGCEGVMMKGCEDEREAAVNTRGCLLQQFCREMTSSISTRRSGRSRSSKSRSKSISRSRVRRPHAWPWKSLEGFHSLLEDGSSCSSSRRRRQRRRRRNDDIQLCKNFTKKGFRNITNIINSNQNNKINATIIVL